MTKDLPNAHAHFHSRYLHALRAILDSADDVRATRPLGLILEPAPGGGVLVVATDGVALAVLHDRAGYANAPMRVSLPASFRDRCAPAKPVRMFWEGFYERALPEWAQPGDVVITPVCAILTPAMQMPDIELGEGPCLENVMIETGDVWSLDDYRVDLAKPVDWRKIFEKAAAQTGAATTALYWQPAAFNMFQPILELSASRSEAVVAVEFTGAGSPALVRVPTVPEFMGCFMPMKAVEAAAGLPEFVGRREARLSVVGGGKA